MATIKATRRTKYKRNFHSSSIKSLQNELLTEVLSHLSCKYFLEVAKDDYIFQCISLENFPIVPLCKSNEASSFLKRCEEFGNPESLFRQRVIDYFSLTMIESELVYLKRAAEKGHSEATYVYEIILLCSEDQLKQEGLKILSSLKMTKSSGLKECRKRMRTVMRDMWIRNSIVRQQVLCSRKEPCHVLKKKRGWESSDHELDEDDNTLCEACSCNCEITWFSNMLG
ncbi:hypothetical protein ACB098_05G126000 [Castanea mollissima]